MDEADVLRLLRDLLTAARSPWGALEQVLRGLQAPVPVRPPPGRPSPDQPPPARLPVIGDMPEGVPPAALQAEPSLPAPSAWPFPESFPRTCGTGRTDAGASYWTDFLYDDHGAIGDYTALPAALFAPSRGSYSYPAGPSAGNGADIFRAAIGLDETSTWWRVDWTTLIDAGVPIAAFSLDTDLDTTTGVSAWPAGAGVRSAGADQFLVLSGAGAWLIDGQSGERRAVADLGGEHHVDMAARSFLVRLPHGALAPAGRCRVRLVSGLANDSGEAFAPVGLSHGALPGQPAVYNVAFRDYQQEPASLNFCHDAAQAAALTDGDISAFFLDVDWNDLAAKRATPEPLPVGHTNRWYVSSVELGQGVGPHPLTHARPCYLGRLQVYAVEVPSRYDPAHAVPLTFLLHSLETNHNQFAAIDPRLVREASEDRGSICVTPAGRGPTGWYLDEAELDFWEVWARVAEAYHVDPDRTVLSGYSMGGYGTYRLGLAYPEAFAKAVVLAGPPRCGVRLLPDIGIPADIDPHSRCAQDGETYRLLGNARWLPFVVAHGLIDELVPVVGVALQVAELARLGYRVRFELYPVEDHILYAIEDSFASPVAHMGTGLRQPDPGHVTFAWYPALRRDDLGIGSRQVWWIADLEANDSGPGVLAEVDARSLARPDPAVTTHVAGSFVLGLDTSAGLAAEQSWQLGPPPARHPELGLRLRNTARLSIDVARAGFHPGETGAIQAATDCPTTLTLRSLAPGTGVHVDGTSVTTADAHGNADVLLAKGHHHVQFG